MKIKIAAVLAVLALLPAAADAQVREVGFGYGDISKDVAVIGGRTDMGKDTKITVSVFKKDKSYADINADGEDVSDILVNADTAYADDGGNWSVEWKAAESGGYDIYISENGENYTVFSQYIVSGMQKNYDTLKNGTKQELEDMFAEKDAFCGFFTDENERKKISNCKELGTAAYNVRESFDDKSKIYENLDIVLLEEALREKADAASADELLTLLDKKGMGADFYKTYLSATEKVKKAAAAKLAPALYTKKLSEANAALKEQLILSGVKNSVNWTEAMNYLELLGSAEYAKNKQKAAMAVVGGDYTISSLEEAIKAAVNQKEPSGGGTGGSSGGSGGTSKVIIPDNSSATEPVKQPEANKIFNDVPPEHWAYDYINYLRWNDIADGDSDGNFNPESGITRAEFTKLLCCAFKLEDAPGTVSFEDVAQTAWYFKYIRTAAGNNIIYGDSDGNFNPDSKITRKDIAAIIYRIAKSKGMEFSAEKQFNDSGDIAEYAREAVAYLGGAGILSGDGRFFRPNGNATRAEAAAIIYQLIKKL